MNTELTAAALNLQPVAPSGPSRVMAFTSDQVSLISQLIRDEAGRLDVELEEMKRLRISSEEAATNPGSSDNLSYHMTRAIALFDRRIIETRANIAALDDLIEILADE